MTVLLAELTREQIRQKAPNAVAVLPTASVEQHGPHLPVLTDTLLCGTVAERAVEEVGASKNILVAPVFCYGRSHHHRPFPGVLSLSTETYMRAISDLLEGLTLSGFKKIVVLNGHGGNSAPNEVVCADFIQSHHHKVTVASASYWDIARDALVEAGLIPSESIPGHAGRFEASMVMALRPDLVSKEELANTDRQQESGDAVATSLSGGTVQTHGAWAASRGYTDRPSQANAQDGQSLLSIAVREVAAFLSEFAQI